MPSSPGFVSFNDYLNANSGSLGSERQSVVSGAEAAGQKAQSDYDALSKQAYDQGTAAGQASWSKQRADAAAGGKPITSSEQYVAPTAAPTLDSTKLDTTQLASDAAKAKDAFGALTAGNVGSGKSPFEASLLQGSADFQGQGEALQKKYGTAVNDYLNGLQTQASAGQAAFKPAPIMSTQITGQPDESGNGPYNKPRVTRTPVVNGVPVETNTEEGTPIYGRRRGAQAP